MTGQEVKMTTREDFVNAWRMRFPVDKPPDLDCFRALKTDGGVEQINLDKVREEKRNFENRILALKNQLHQHEFIVGFLWEVLHGPKSPDISDLGQSDNIEAPREPPPPVPQSGLNRAMAKSSVKRDPDLGLDCEVPVDEPRRSDSQKHIPQVPAYLETNLDFDVVRETVKVEHSGPVLTRPSNGSLKIGSKVCPSKEKKPLGKIDKSLSLDRGTTCNVGTKRVPLSETRQQSFDDQRGLKTPDVTTEHGLSRVSHGAKDTHEQTNSTGKHSPAHPHSTKPEHFGSTELDKARLMRKLSADSNTPSTTPNKDLLGNQRKTYNFVPYVEVDVKKTFINSDSNAAGGFSTFKPAPIQIVSSDAAESKHKPVPAPRPSLVGPEYKVRNRPESAMFNTGGDDLSPVLENDMKLPIGGDTDSTSSHKDTNPSIPMTASAPLPLSHTESISGYSDVRHSRKDKPQTFRKPPRQNYINFELKNDSSTDTKVPSPDPPVMAVKPVGCDAPSQNNNKKSTETPSLNKSPVPPRSRGSTASNTSTGGVHPVHVPTKDTSNKRTPDFVEKIYEEPIPVRVDRVEEASSSEEDEPVYQNLMLLKQRSMARGPSASRPSGMFTTVDYQKKQLHKQAERLSRRYSTNMDTQPTGSLSRYAGTDQLKTIGENGASRPKQGAAGIAQSSSPDGSPAWRKRHSMMYATGDDTTSEDDLDALVPTCAETEKVQMRKWVVTSIVSSERAYLLILDTLLQYMQTFKNVLNTPQLVITAEDIEGIFYKIPELHRIHFNFIKKLEPKLEKWTGEEHVAEEFKILALEECPLAADYLKNYQKALSAVRRCTTDSETFADLTKTITCKGIEEKSSLEELLHKPVVRFQRNTLVLHDLIKFTPTSHPDYDTLQKTRKIAQNFLEKFESPMNKSNAENQRYLSKQGLVVEKVGSGTQRKLRYIFLFNDVVVCAKQKFSRQKLTFEVKWFIPIQDVIVMDDRHIAHEERQLSENTKTETERLQKKVSELQNELKTEMKRMKLADGQRSWSFRSHKNNLEKIRKKLFEQEGSLVLASPHLIFKLKNKKAEKAYSLLLASDYERNSWKETITGLQHKPLLPGSMSTVELTTLVNSIKLPKVSSTGSIDLDDFELEDEALFGSLDVTIHRLYGLKSACDVFCCMEVDSYAHFSMKAKTNILTKTSEPKWNENFDIELDGAQTLRVLCYKMEGDTDTLIGKCALELGKGWLRGDFSEEAISIAESMTLVITLKYRNREQTIRRTPSSIQGGLFGVKISSVTKRENTTIPLIVKYCVEEVERRGMDDVGIYRISGLSAEVQRLKKAFEKSPVGAAQVMKEMDINVVTGLLKLYFRELPESLFTDKLYMRLQEGLTLSDPEAKEKFMMTLLQSLPEPNLTTVGFMMDHLVRVTQNDAKNKMSLHNIATVFGPTLLRPASKESEPVSMEQLFTAGARDAMMQTGILYFYLTSWPNKDRQNTRNDQLISTRVVAFY